MTEKVNYISLKEAADYSGYSQDYLSLRARQNKLKALKIARNWVTSKEWIDDYLRRVEKVKREKGPKQKKIKKPEQPKLPREVKPKGQSAAKKKLLTVLVLVLIVILIGTILLDYIGCRPDFSGLIGKIREGFRDFSKNMFIGFSLTQDLFSRGLERSKDFLSRGYLITLEGLNKSREKILTVLSDSLEGISNFINGSSGFIPAKEIKMEN